jgi:hypothetical protein
LHERLGELIDAPERAAEQLTEAIDRVRAGHKHCDASNTGNDCRG